MRVFVDSGVYFDYLKGKGVRLHVLQTFEELLEQKKFKLIFPTITKEEIYRGIPLDYGRYAQNKFLTYSIPDVPAGVEEIEDYKKAKELFEQYSQKIEDVRKKSLDAVDDILKNHIEKLMKNAESIQEDQSILEAAKIRKLKGNPPGKSNDPLGDEIVWELLLDQCTDEDLVIIAHDGDWKYTENGKTTIHPFLQKEWDKKSPERKLEIYQSLAPFVDTLAPKKVTTEDIESEKKSTVPPAYYSVNPASLVGPRDSISLSSLATLPAQPTTWQPVTVGTIANEMIVCPSCDNVFNPRMYILLSAPGHIICPLCATAIPTVG